MDSIHFACHQMLLGPCAATAENTQPSIRVLVDFKDENALSIWKDRIVSVVVCQRDVL